MAVEKIDTVNFDYEYELFFGQQFVPNSKDQELFKEFEYIYFFMQAQAVRLHAKNEYAEDYLAYLQHIGLSLPEFYKVPVVASVGRYSYKAPPPPPPPPSYNYWWGALENLPLERTLNSKVTSVLVAQKQNLGHPLTRLLKSDDELLAYSIKYQDRDLLMKHPFLMSGRGHRSVPALSSIKQRNVHMEWGRKFFQQNPDVPLIVEPKLTIPIEISAWVEVNAPQQKVTLSFHQNFSHPSGGYRGGLIFQKEQDFLPYLQQKYGSIIAAGATEIMQGQQKGALHYVQHLQAERDFGIDGLLYEEEKHIKSYSLSEVNYRKTMGKFLHCMRSYLSEGWVGRWCIWPMPQQGNFARFSDILHFFQKAPWVKKYPHISVIVTSPAGKHFLTCFVMAKSEGEISQYLQEANQQLRPSST